MDQPSSKSMSEYFDHPRKKHDSPLVVTFHFLVESVSIKMCHGHLNFAIFYSKGGVKTLCSAINIFATSEILS